MNETSVPQILLGDTFSLVLKSVDYHSGVPVYNFQITSISTQEKLGSISFRNGQTEEEWLYYGHIGYSIKEAHRGQHYAARSVKVLIEKFIKRYFK